MNQPTDKGARKRLSIATISLAWPSCVASRRIQFRTRKLMMNWGPGTSLILRMVVL